LINLIFHLKYFPILSKTKLKVEQAISENREIEVELWLDKEMNDACKSLKSTEADLEDMDSIKCAP